MAFIVALFHLLKSLTDEVEEETGVSGENPDDEFQKQATY